MEVKKFGETREYVPRSNAHLVEEFSKSVIWVDMEAELNVWLTEIRDLLENPESPDSITQGLRGSAIAIRNMLILPETLAENMRADNKADDEKEKHDGSEGD